MRLLEILPPVFLTLAAGSAAWAKSESAYRGSAAAQTAAKSGKKVVAEIAADLDGDYTDEICVVEESRDRKMRLLVMHQEGEGDEARFTTLYASKPRPATRLARFEAMQVLATRPVELVTVFEDATPDERAQHLTILGRTAKGVGELLVQSFYLPREEDPALVSLGDASARYALIDLDGTREGETDLEVVWYAEPQVLVLNGAEGPVRAVIGVYKDVYRFDEPSGAFEKAGARVLEDFAPARTAWTVEASDQLPKIWGTAQAFWGADDNLATSWSVTGGDAGVGAWIKVGFKKDETVSLVRVVPGCARSAEEWERNDKVRGFRIDLGSGARFEIDRTKLDALPQAVLAVGEFPLEGGFGAQTLLLLRDRASTGWARLTITSLDAKRGGKGVDREACISEISFH